MSFEKWLAEVDKILNRTYGLSHDDLPDIDYRSLYEDGATAIEAAEEAVENAME